MQKSSWFLVIWDDSCIDFSLFDPSKILRFWGLNLRRCSLIESLACIFSRNLWEPPVWASPFDMSSNYVSFSLSVLRGMEKITTRLHSFSAHFFSFKWRFWSTVISLDPFLASKIFKYLNKIYSAQWTQLSSNNEPFIDEFIFSRHILSAFTNWLWPVWELCHYLFSL